MKKRSLLHVRPKVAAPLDPCFFPCSTGNRNYEAALLRSAKTEKVVVAMERENELVSRKEFRILPLGSNRDQDTLHYIERNIKFMLWAYGGWKIYIAGPKKIGEIISRLYSVGGERAFDAELMQCAYDRPLEVQLTAESDVPAARSHPTAVGGHLEGCRLGFDLGGSDYKISAMIDGKVIFRKEYPWNPKDHSNPEYHRSRLEAGLAEAAAKMPRVDAIGGSSAGIIIDNRVQIASLFRSIPKELFNKEIKGLFTDIGKRWKVPIVVMNDGDITALAGGLSLRENAVFGMSMGSSEAGGYLDPEGRITGWLNELAFAPVDYSPQAALDPWSKDRGVGAMYFSQQAVGKLLSAAGIELPETMPLPEKLIEVQKLIADQDERAKKVYETIGVYLGYAIPHYLSFYDFSNFFILGRVSSGLGGEIILAKAHEVLKDEFPDIFGVLRLQLPDEDSKRVGQSIAAASLPNLFSPQTLPDSVVREWNASLNLFQPSSEMSP